MTDSSARLPDDMSRWPADPYSLLGISREADKSDARRAYIRLIRRFKPEHAPAEFQKIRAAFETVQHQIEFRERFETLYGASDDDVEPDDDEAESASRSEAGPRADASIDDRSKVGPHSKRDRDAPVSAPPASEFRNAGESMSTQPEREDADVGDSTSASPPDRSTGRRSSSGPVAAPSGRRRMEDVWQLALRGKVSDAYAILFSMFNGGQDAMRAALRMYWLLSVDPSLDEQREPQDWLVVALRASRLRGPAAELYRRELAGRREEALHARAASLLDVDAELGSLADLLTWRWRALSFLQRGDLIASDVRQVWKRFADHDDDLWCRVLLSALDCMIWFRRENPVVLSVWKEATRELKALPHVHARMASEFDRLDLLELLAEEWFRIQVEFRTPVRWKALVPLCWTQEWNQAQDEAINVMAEIAAQPLESLVALDRLHESSRAFTAQLATIARRAANMLASNDARASWTQISDRVQRFLLRNNTSYFEMRRQLLTFCIREAIDPDLVGRVADEVSINQPGDVSNLSDIIAGDLPLAIVYQAVAAIHS